MEYHSWPDAISLADMSVVYMALTLKKFMPATLEDPEYRTGWCGRVLPIEELYFQKQIFITENR